MTDFRVDVGFYDHIKTKRLERALGFAGIKALQKLWSYAAKNMYDGDKIYSADDIELAVDWEREPGSLVNTLATVRFLDETEGGYTIHNWEKRNGFAASAKKRSDIARENANKRWCRKQKVTGKTDEMPSNAIVNATSCEPQSEGIADAMPDYANGNAPSPSPLPSPSLKKEENTYVVSDPPKKQKAARTRHEYSPEYETFFAVYPARNGQKNGKHAGQKAFDKALREKGITPDFLTDRIRELALQYGDYPPDIATWLNNRRWEDPVAEPANDFERDLAAMRQAAAKRDLQ